ncbi:hypothetical protein ACH5RR_010967 [Cinchona calisaya]|uniref:Uncharacterized protein n=1 Tax=Cinchona calisaya TaxID=153742 RepID=A0ABD3A3I8_9GENT
MYLFLHRVKRGFVKRKKVVPKTFLVSALYGICYAVVSCMDQKYSKKAPKASNSSGVGEFYYTKLSQEECINKRALLYRSSWHELISAFRSPARNPALVGFPEGTTKVYLLSCASHLFHEDDLLDSLQHHEQRGVCLTTGFV